MNMEGRQRLPGRGPKAVEQEGGSGFGEDTAACLGSPRKAMETHRKQREVSEMASALCTHVTCCSRYEWQKTAKEKILLARSTKTSASAADVRGSLWRCPQKTVLC